MYTAALPIRGVAGTDASSAFCVGEVLYSGSLNCVIGKGSA